MMQNNIEDFPVLARLYQTIASRKGSDPASSYTASLFSRGAAHCARKFGEEAVEAVIAGVSDDKAALVSESADVLYHLLVLLAAKDITLDDVCNELAKREGMSGHEEKAKRGI